MGRTFFLETWYPEVELLKKAAALLRTRCISCRGSENERMACGFAMRVVAWGILSRPNTPIRQRSDSRALISLFIGFQRALCYECWHECLVDTVDSASADR